MLTKKQFLFISRFHVVICDGYHVSFSGETDYFSGWYTSWYLDFTGVSKVLLILESSKSVSDYVKLLG